MPYIIREDGEHFVIPSYRDVLSAKNKNLLKKDILLLSQNYGEYITLQRKSPVQYEVAFSPETGYLLGESIWHYFQRPFDMIYCEAIPNTTEAILVIVKSGSVYLDGSFPLDTIPEELIIFLTQKNNFEIYIYGNVPISHGQEEGKFSFEPSSVKSFTVLDKPVFSTLPLLKIYQLQLVEQVLKTHGIGVFPTRQLVLALLAIAFIYMLYSFYVSQRAVEPAPIVPQENPYKDYYTALATPAPNEEINKFLEKLSLLFSMPGWVPTKIDYEKGSLSAAVKSNGGKIEALVDWVKANNGKIDIKTDGFYVTLLVFAPNRPLATRIYSLRDVLARFIDNLSNVYPGNNLTIGQITSKANYTELVFTVDVVNVSPIVLKLIGEQFKDLPFVLQKISLTVDDGSSLTGSIFLMALGN